MKVSLDIFSNRCKVTIYLFGIKFIKININLISLTFEINNNKKEKSLNLFLTKEQEYLLRQIKKTILDKLYYDEILVDYEFAMGNPSVSALAIGIINAILNLLKFRMLNSNGDVDIIVKSKSKLNNFTINLEMQIKVFFTLFDLLFALVISFYKRGIYVKQKR